MKNLSHAELSALIERSAKAQAEQARADDDRVVASFKAGVLPTSGDNARIVTWRVGKARSDLIRHHPYWRESRLRAGLDALISSALAAHVDLCRCEAALTAFAESRERFEDHVDRTVQNPAQKEVLAFCAAYFGTIDTLRRIKSARPDIADAIDSVRAKHTDEPVFRFMLDLRKNLSHGSVVVPGWLVTSDATSAAGVMQFDTDDLLAFGEWRAEVRTLLEGAPERRLHISKSISYCATALARMRRDLKELFAVHQTTAESDFHRLQDLHQRTTSGTWIKVFLSPHATRGTDPYPHLHRFFTAEEVRAILRRPNNSAEQVEFIIALRSVQTACDDHLRKMLYQLFNAPMPAELKQMKSQAPSLHPPPLDEIH